MHLSFSITFILLQIEGKHILFILHNKSIFLATTIQDTGFHQRSSLGYNTSIDSDAIFLPF